jgi:endoglucanase
MPPLRRPHARVACTVILVIMFTFMLGLAVARPVAAVRVPSSAPTGLHVVGQQLLDGANHPLILRGVNRSGSEYACIQGWGFFDGPNDLASAQAIAAWGTNAVRIPMNEDCWLNINGAPPAYSGTAYKNAIAGYVATVQAAGLVPILELHWTGAGASMATGQQPMLNRDHSVAFWQQVANAYRNNTGVLFDLHNEPYPDGNRDTAAAWDCWKNGTTTGNAATCPGSGLTYQAAGMQELVNTVRATGASNPILLGGVQYANALSQWLAYKPQDPTGNLIAAWHVYNFNVCNSTTCYNATAAPVAASVPLVAGEIGENDCGTAMLTTLMNWLDNHNAGYLAWTWDTWGTACANLSLITDYAGTPTAYGQAYKDHLALVQPTPTPTPTPCTAGQFSDVPPGSTFYPYATCLVNRGIISGYADCTFRPNNPVTRGQLSKIVSNSAGFNDPPGAQMFQDVPPGATFYDWVQRLASRGYIGGYPCGGPGEPCVAPTNRPYFRPSSNATRGQIAKIVSNAAGFSDPIPAGQFTFADVPEGSPFHLFVERLLLNRPGVMGGYPCGGPSEPCIHPGNRPYFRPSSNATRGQTSKIVANTFFPNCQPAKR